MLDFLSKVCYYQFIFYDLNFIDFLFLVSVKVCIDYFPLSDTVDNLNDFGNLVEQDDWHNFENYFDWPDLLDYNDFVNFYLDMEDYI